MSADAPVSHFEVVIVPDDIDEFDHVNNAFYLRWVQKVVVAHWTRLSETEWLDAHLWVALRHEIFYRQPIFLGDDVVAHVKVTKTRGVRATFQTSFLRNGVVLANVESDWCCLDSSNKKPKRISDAISQRFLGLAVQ